MRYRNLTREIYTKLFFSSLIIQIVGTISFLLDFIIPGTFLGEEALSVITLTLPLLLLMQAFIDLVSMGGSNAYSLAIGAGKPREAQRYYTATLGGALLISVAALLLGCFFLTPLTRLLGADAHLLALTSQVTLLTLAYFPFMSILMCLDFFLRNDGLIKISAAVSVFFIASNIALNIYLVGYTALGLLGAPLSSLLSAVLSLLLASPVFICKKTTLRLTKEASLTDFWYVVHMGSGLTFKRVYQGLAAVIFNNFLMSSVGMTGVVVYSIVVNIQNLLLSLLDTLRECLQPLIGVYSGENNQPGMKETLRCCFKTGAASCALFWLLLSFLPITWLHIFGITDTALLALCQIAIIIYSSVFPFLCFTEIMSSYYQFIGYPRLTFYILTLKGLLLLLPISLLGFKLYGLPGLWAGFVVTEICACACTLFLAKRQASQSPQSLSPFLLLPTGQKDNLLILDILANKANLGSALDEIESFLQKRGFSQNTRDRVRHCLEELGLNSIQHNPGKTDARLELQIKTGGDVKVTLRDNCSAFNTTVPREQKIKPKLGLTLVHKLADTITYVPTIGYNRTILLFQENKLKRGNAL